MPESKVSLRMIAERVNVSTAAVSCVLNGKGRMSPEKRLAIQRILREAGYRPRHKRLPVFYVLSEQGFRDMHAFEPFFRNFHGLSDVLYAEQVTLRPFFLRLDGAAVANTELKDLLAMNVGGVFLDASLEKAMGGICQTLCREEVPAVQVGHVALSPAVDAVVVDNFGGAYDATHYLVSRGHQRIATIRWNVAGDPASNRKFAGFTCALVEAGIPIRPEYVVESPFTKAGGLQPGRVAVAQLLALPDPPTAVFVENSFISPALIYPQDTTERELPAAIRALDMVHFEAWNLEWIEQALASKLNYPPRKTRLMRINWEEVGRAAARVLLARMESRKTTNPQVVGLAPRLYEIDGYDATPIEVQPNTLSHRTEV